MMSQKNKTSNELCYETVICEKYMAKLLENELKVRNGPNLTNSRSRDKNVKHSCLGPINRTKLSAQSPKRCRSPKSSLEYTDDGALVKVTVKTPNSRKRSPSYTADRESWGQILKSQKGNDSLSIFSNFDPLRTLHFLIKELEYQLQELLPENTCKTILQMIVDMQAALKRIPPEVASTIHLQQTTDITEKNKLVERETQTILINNPEREDFKKKLQENLIVFETKCLQMENVSVKLRSEKEELEKQLSISKENITHYKIKAEELERETVNVLFPKIKSLELDKGKLESELDSLAMTFETRYSSTTNDLKMQMNEMKSAKVLADQDNAKFKHQLRVLSIEKEKYITILAARDRQISEIRGEMIQLQEAVNEQLRELRKNSLKAFSSNDNIVEKDGNVREKLQNVGDWTVSNSSSNEDQRHRIFVNKPNVAFKDLPSGDIDVPENSNAVQNYSENERNSSARKQLESNAFLDKLDSHTSIRSLFNEVKRTALAISISPKCSINSDTNENLEI